MANPIVRKTQGKVLEKIAPAAGAIAAVGAAVAGGWIAYSNLAIDHNRMLPEALQADRKAFDSEYAGRVSYYADESQGGRPLVLIHSINAAASSLEMSPLFNHYRANRRVYSVDLPGYGFSERSDRPYTPALFQAAILDFLETQVGEPADVVALSLGSEFAATAALTEPERFHSLALISPTGLKKPSKKRGPQQLGETNRDNQAHKLLSFPLWQRPLYDLIATRRSIRYFLQQSLAMPVPPEMVEYAYLTSHQPGAQHAPLYFLGGVLFTPGVKELVYERITSTPVLVLYDQDPFTSFELLDGLLDTNQNWKANRVAPSRGLPHWDNFRATTTVLDDFWGSQS